MRLSCLAACAAAVLAAHPYVTHAAAPNMKEGLWEITTKVDMPGMPAGMPPQVIKQCVTKKDLEDPKKITSAGGGKMDDRCQVSDYKMQGNTASWNWVCKGQEDMRGSGTMTFAGNSYTGVTKLAMKQGGQTHNMTMHYNGKHLGDCK